MYVSAVTEIGISFQISQVNKTGGFNGKGTANTSQCPTKLSKLLFSE